MSQNRYILGVDFGTDSVRAVVVNAGTGREEANEVSPYRRWAEGRYCNPARNQFRQHPLDYIESLEACVKGALARLPAGAGRHVAGIGIDTTGSTPGPVDRQGTPLALRKELAENPNAMFVLWKDHTAVKEAEEINRAARGWGGTDFTRYEGGVYSSEWFWAKILHVLREDEAVRRTAFSWVEHCDWMPALLAGRTDPLSLKRSRTAAGHKAMWHAKWGGLPAEEFLTRIDPLLRGLRERLYTETFTADVPAGRLTPEWAARLGLEPGIPVAVGSFDAHVGAVGGGITPATLAKIMGTSTCDMIVAPEEAVGGRTVAGICGQVDGSIVPGLIGLEAGQSGFGDVYAWFARLLAWPLEAIEVPGSPKDAERMRGEIRIRILDRLAEEAGRLSPAETGLLALDWLNGRRTPDADQSLKGAVIGLTLGTTAPAVFRALVEATAFGSKAIVDRFLEQGVAIREVVALGGISQKSPFVMQVTADVLDMPIKVARSEQTTALGAAMFGAVAAGIYGSVPEAQAKMGSGFRTTYTPDPARAGQYRSLYDKYLELGRILEEPLRALG
jgi:L-ribulokinase